MVVNRLQGGYAMLSTILSAVCVVLNLAVLVPVIRGWKE